MYVIVTRVSVVEGAIDKVATLFRETNPDLVNSENDWLSGQMSVNRATNMVQVIATWTTKESYEAFAGSNAFESTMKRFSDYFAKPPLVEHFEVLEQMTRQGTEIKLD